jgi:hypothetical protein
MVHSAVRRADLSEQPHSHHRALRGGEVTDSYFDNNGGAPLLLLTQFIQGWAGRVTAGLAYNINGGPKLSVGGELGGIGNDFLTWSVRGRASLPF